MKIQEMFVDDINRKINGVIKVDQEDNSTEQELNEYVITRELKKHFITFFNNYDDAFDVPTSDIGVWISGFFGSGKSHFLKMLSYILETGPSMVFRPSSGSGRNSQMIRRPSCSLTRRQRLRQRRFFSILILRASAIRTILPC